MADLTLPALTLWPEWAFAVTDLGKACENRPERVCKAVVKAVGDGWLAIHAGKSAGGMPGRSAFFSGYKAVQREADRAGLPDPWACRVLWAPISGQRMVMVRPPVSHQPLTHVILTTSAIVALVRVPRILPPGHQAPWKLTTSPALALEGLLLLPRPVPCKGAQGVWRLPVDVHAAVMAQVEEAPHA